MGNTLIFNHWIARISSCEVCKPYSENEIFPTSIFCIFPVFSLRTVCEVRDSATRRIVTLLPQEKAKSGCDVSRVPPFFVFFSALGGFSEVEILGYQTRQPRHLDAVFVPPSPSRCLRNQVFGAGLSPTITNLIGVSIAIS